MKRILLIFMLVALPLQMTWAAMAAYCSHEAGASARHLGHHFHNHKTSTDDPSSDPARGTSKAHADCHFCQAAGHNVIQPALAEHQFDKRNLVQVGFVPHSYSSFFPEGPDRPRWPRFA